MNSTIETIRKWLRILCCQHQWVAIKYPTPRVQCAGCGLYIER